MNIFVLDTNPVIAAQQQCNKHVVKMPLETAQMLSTIAHSHGINTRYRPTHLHHPCTIWAGSSVESFNWLVAHGIALCDEYTNRYNKIHKSKSVIEEISSSNIRQYLSAAPMPSFAQAMPDQYKQQDPVSAYRAYYIGDKARFAVWSYRQVPDWFTV